MNSTTIHVGLGSTSPGHDPTQFLHKPISFSIQIVSDEPAYRSPLFRGALGYFSHLDDAFRLNGVYTTWLGENY